MAELSKDSIKNCEDNWGKCSGCYVKQLCTQWLSEVDEEVKSTLIDKINSEILEVKNGKGRRKSSK